MLSKLDLMALVDGRLVVSILQIEQPSGAPLFEYSYTPPGLAMVEVVYSGDSVGLPEVALSRLDAVGTVQRLFAPRPVEFLDGLA